MIYAKVITDTFSGEKNSCGRVKGGHFLQTEWNQLDKFFPNIDDVFIFDATSGLCTAITVQINYGTELKFYIELFSRDRWRCC